VEDGAKKAHISPFAQDGSGSISAKELLYVMRSMGQNPVRKTLDSA